MEIKRRTPRTDLIYQTIKIKADGLDRAVAASEGVHWAVAEVSVDNFLNLSARWTPNGTPLDFELAAISDDASDIKRKYLAYLDSEHVDQIDQALLALMKMDLPADKTLAPDAPSEAQTPPGE